jgi:two-component system, sensor histidine kinase and response regulator
VTGQEPAVDLAAVLDRIGGDEALLREIVGLYFEDEPRLLDEAATALRSRDADLLRRSAHTLKGAVSNFCAPAAWSAAQALESAGRDGRLDDAGALYDALLAELARVREALSPFRP